VQHARGRVPELDDKTVQVRGCGDHA
jgi:hypothetical protein